MTDTTARTRTLAAKRRREVAGELVHSDRVHGIDVRDKRGQLVVEWRVHPDPMMGGLQLAELRGMLDGLEYSFVENLRASGLSWDEIGDVWGMSRQGIQKKFAATEAALRGRLAGGDTP